MLLFAVSVSLIGQMQHVTRLHMALGLRILMLYIAECAINLFFLN